MLYIGVTNSVVNRVWQHKFGDSEGFTKKYKVTNLVYWESLGDVRDAIAREKELKGWLRRRKIVLIEGMNPKWRDLAANWSAVQPESKVLRRFAKKNQVILGETGVEPIH